MRFSFYECIIYRQEERKAAFQQFLLPDSALRVSDEFAVNFKTMSYEPNWFYPDLVCRLEDGRVLVVEYKGGYLYTASDAEEKRAVGAVREARGDGQCLFVMPTAGDLDRIEQKTCK